MAKEYRRFVPEDEYVQHFKDMIFPPVIDPYVVRDGMAGYMVICAPDHPEAEEEEKPLASPILIQELIAAGMTEEEIGDRFAIPHITEDDVKSARAQFMIHKEGISK